MSFLGELKRRNVIRVAVAYLVFAWLVMQVLDVLSPVLELPQSGLRMVLVMLALGFVGAVVFSWAYELTPDGLKRESEVDRAQSVTHITAKKLDLAVIALLVLAIGLFVFDRVSPERETAKPSTADRSPPASVTPAASAPATATTKSIAVLPFVNMSSDAEQVYFSDGISEQLLNGLVKLPGLKVAGRTSSFSFRNKQEDLRAIGKALGVGHILEGSVRKQGTRVRITAQLIKADDGFHLWSETYDRDAGDIFALQDEITAAIVDALKLKLGPDAVPTASVADPDAFNLYLKARQKLALRGVANLEAARRLFEQAIARDPDYAPAHAGLSRAVSLLVPFGADISLEQATQSATSAARAALALDPGNAEAWSVLGYIDWGLTAAEEAVNRSLALSPNDAEIVNFAGDYYVGTFDPRAEATERRAVELDPLHGVNHFDLAKVLYDQGKFEAALEAAAAADALGFYDASPSFHFISTLPALLGLKRFDDARRLVAKVEATARVPAASVLSARLSIAHAEGDLATAESLLQELAPRAVAGELPASTMAWHLMKMGRLDEAVPWLQRALAKGDLGVESELGMFGLPERLPDHAALRAAFNRPELLPLFEIRRRNLAKQGEAQP